MYINKNNLLINRVDSVFKYTYFDEDISVSTWNLNDGLKFIRWYRNNPQNSPSPFTNNPFIKSGKKIVEWLGSKSKAELYSTQKIKGFKMIRLIDLECIENF